MAEAAAEEWGAEGAGLTTTGSAGGAEATAGAGGVATGGFATTGPATGRLAIAGGTTKLGVAGRGMGTIRLGAGASDVAAGLAASVLTAEAAEETGAVGACAAGAAILGLETTGRAPVGVVPAGAAAAGLATTGGRPAGLATVTAGRAGGAILAACSACLRSRIALSASPGLEICERLNADRASGCVVRAERAPRLLKYSRTLSASSTSMELECVFFSVTPTAIRASRMDLLLTSNSRARSLMRTLLIRPFSVPLRT